MRLTFALAITLTLLAPSAHAQSAAWVDAAGDEGLVLSGQGDTQIKVFGIEAGDCEAPAADIRALGINAGADFITLTLTLASLSDLSFECGIGLGSSAASARYDASWREILGEDAELTAVAYGLSAHAETTGFGLASCIRIDYADFNGARGDCIGQAAVVGNSVVWTLPVRGAELVEVFDDAATGTSHFETRAWDFSSFGGEVRGSSGMDIENVFGSGWTSFRDSVFGDEFTA